MLIVICTFIFFIISSTIIRRTTAYHISNGYLIAKRKIFWTWWDEKSCSLNQVQMIYLKKEQLLSNQSSSKSFYFYKERFEDWNEENISPILVFKAVDSTPDLLKCLHSVIKLQKHPKLEDVYQRI
ncbi:MAG: hypothetical protein ACTSQI_21550 [Candidatus Helarchaeota archaeon]